MDTLDALLAGIVADPLEETWWLVLADWLEENDDPRRAELLRLHRRLLATCCEPDAHSDRAAWQARVVELLVAGVYPCVPQRTLELPGGVTLVGSFIPPGSFLMGGTVAEVENDRPVHRVALTASFFMGVYAVTQGQWAAVMGTDPGRFKGPNRPVESVSWGECEEFCTKLTAHLDGRAVRLPTEAEWEWACRAGTTTHFYFGDVINTDLVNYNGADPWNGSPVAPERGETTDVGSFPSNPWGLFDMHGNVWEWFADWYANYTGEDRTDPFVQESQSRRSRAMPAIPGLPATFELPAIRGLRGGAYGYSPRFCRSASRHGFASERRDDYGFRVCF